MNDSKFEFADRMVPAFDRVLMQAFSEDGLRWRRFDRSDDPFEKFMDIDLHIDVEVRLPNGARLFGQEKVCRYKWFEKYGAMFTIQHSKPDGRSELEHISAGFYVHAYENKDGNGFQSWVMVDVPRFVLWLNDGCRSFEIKSNQTNGQTFLCVPYAEIPDHCLLAWSSDNKRLMERGGGAW